MRALPSFSVALVALVAVARQTSAADSGRVSPIRRVINMMQALQKKCEEEGELEGKLFDKFMCSCKTSQAQLKKSISDGNEKVPQLQSNVQELTASLGTLASELKQHRKDRAAATKCLKEAAALRAKENKAFLAESTELRANINAIGSALQALKRSGAAGAAFVQTQQGERLKAMALRLPPQRAYDQEILAAFLENRMETQDLGEIKGILSQMRENMQSDLKKSIATEEKAKAEFDQLEGAKGREVATTTKMIEEKEQRLGDSKVSLADKKHELKDTKKSLKSDTNLIRKTNVDCDKRVKEHTELKKTRAMEMTALADAIKILNDDDAQALFRKTAAAKPAALLLQVGSRSAAQSRGVLRRLHRLARRHPDQSNLALVSLVARTHKKGFEKVLGMVDEMVKLLKKEQKDEDKKRTYCLTETERQGGNKKELVEKIKGFDAAKGNVQDNLNAVIAEITTLKSSMQQLDAAVVQATAQRKSENAVFQRDLASNNAALELIEVAKKRLEKFYNAKPAAAAAALDQQGQKQTAVAVNLHDHDHDHDQQYQHDQQDQEELDQQQITAAAGDGEQDQQPKASAPDDQEQKASVPDDQEQILSAAAEGEQGQNQAASASENDSALADDQKEPEQNPAAPAADDQDEMADVSFVQVRARSRARAEVEDESLEELGDADGDRSSDEAKQQEDQNEDAQELGLTGFAEYRKQAGGNGVIRMMDMIKADIKQDVAQLNFAEKDAQKDYEALLKSSQSKRAVSIKAITEKEGVKAKTEEELGKVKGGKKQSQKDLMAVDQVLLNLKAECTNLLKAYSQTKTARANEIENLQKAKSILQGAKIGR